MAELWAVKLGLEMVWNSRLKLLPMELDYLVGYILWQSYGQLNCIFFIFMILLF